MRHRFFCWFGLILGIMFLGMAATRAQEPADVDAIRRERAKLEQTLKKMSKDFDEAIHKQRAEWELKLRKLERENHEAFSKPFREVEKKLKELEQREKSIDRKIEAKEKGFFVSSEIKGHLVIKGRLERKFSPEPPNLFSSVPQVEWWQVSVGDSQYVLISKNSAFPKFAATHVNKSVLVIGEVVQDNRVAVTIFEAVKD